MEVMLMNLEMLGKLVDTLCQDGNLDLWRTSISFMYTGVCDNFRFVFNSQSHLCKSPPYYKVENNKLYFGIITWMVKGRNELRFSPSSKVTFCHEHHALSLRPQGAQRECVMFMAKSHFT